MSRARSTSEADCPARLCPGDLVEASFKGLYLPWFVREVRVIDENTQDVIASHPGRGSLRFTWYGTHVRVGHGHGMTFYFLRRPEVIPGDVWQHSNGGEYRVLFVTNTHNPREDHPPDVVYETLRDPERKWSRALSDWHRSFTLLNRSTKPRNR